MLNRNILTVATLLSLNALLTACGSWGPVFQQRAASASAIDNTTTTGSSLPAPLIAAGGNFACAAFSGVEQCWGTNTEGATSVNGLSGVAALSAGDNHACALVSGAVECWGDNVFNTPLAVAGLPTDITFLTSGGNFNCAVSTSQGVLCWGMGIFDNTYTYPVTSMGIAATGVTQLTAAHNQACMVNSGTPYCWGLDMYSNYNPPAIPSGLDVSQTTTAVAAGMEYVCVVQGAGSVTCTGAFNGYGQQGDGSITSGASLLAIGHAYTCANVSSAGLECWGGEVDGTTTSTPHTVGISGSVTGVSVYDGHACAIAGGNIQCWGDLAQPASTSW